MDDSQMPRRQHGSLPTRPRSPSSLGRLMEPRIVRPLGTRNRVLVESYEPEVVDVILTAKMYYKCRILTWLPYPDDKTSLQWISEVWADASRDWDRYYKATDAIRDLVSAYIVLCVIMMFNSRYRLPALRRVRGGPFEILLCRE